MTHRPARPLFFHLLLVLLALALVGLAGCAWTPEPSRALGPSNGAPDDLPLLLPPPPYGPEGFNGVPVFPRGKGTKTGPPSPDEPPDDEDGDSGKASDTRPPVPTP